MEDEARPVRAHGVRLRVDPGEGLLARRRTGVLFLPPPLLGADLIHHVLAGFLDDDDSLVIGFAQALLVDWAGDQDADGTVPLHTLGPVNSWSDEVTGTIIIGTDSTPGSQVEEWTDLAGGVVPAGGFRLEFGAGRRTPTVLPAHAEVTVEPPQFAELADLDVTLAPVGPVVYPDDDTDRTSRRPGDIRCPRGHSNANTNLTCRVCDLPLGSTAARPGPRASTAIAGLRLPDGSVIPLNRSIVVGRSPTTEGARLDGDPRLVSIDAPTSVSRTHVVFRLTPDGVTVTDCEARGRTAVIGVDGPHPTALVPWEPRIVTIGDTIKLGGPTTLMIADPAELRLPTALDPTAAPPERDETT